MDQKEFQRKLVEKVAEMVAPPVENSHSEPSKATFLASNIFGRYLAHKEADETNSDSCSKVCNNCFLHTHTHTQSFGICPGLPG